LFLKIFFYSILYDKNEFLGDKFKLFISFIVQANYNYYKYKPILTLKIIKSEFNLNFEITRQNEKITKTPQLSMKVEVTTFYTNVLLLISGSYVVDHQVWLQ
jgi:hypothetical protein